MPQTITPRLRQQLQVQLLASRATLEAQRRAHLAGHGRAAPVRELLLQDGDDAARCDAERGVDVDRTDRADRDAVALAEIDQALQRLDSDRFGLCAACGEPIALARLQLEPQALRCLACEAWPARPCASTAAATRRRIDDHPDPFQPQGD